VRKNNATLYYCNLLWFEEFFLGVTDERKKNTKANKKNKRTIVIPALLL